MIQRTVDTPDRRHRPRLRLAYSVRLYRSGETSRIDTKTEDISCEGFFFVTDRVLSPHETFDCELVIPSEDIGQPLGNDMVLRCRAEVVRVVPQADNTMLGVACRLADYIINGQTVSGDLAVGCGT